MDILSPQAIKNQVISNSIQHPIVIYSGVVGAIGAVYSLLFSGELLSWGVTIAATALCFSKLLWGYKVNYNSHAKAIVEKYHRSLLQQREQTLVDLKQELSQIKQQDALKQVDQLGLKFNAFQQVLDRVLNKDELAYSRYITMAEAVFIGALDNLQTVIVNTKAVSGIDIDYIQQQLSDLNCQLTQITSPQILLEQKIDALQHRIVIYKDAHQHITTVLIENEQAMTELDRVTTQLSQISLLSSQQGMELETAMEELRLLAQRAQKYSTR